MKKLSFLLFITAALSGCGEHTSVQTLDWYKTHNAERTAMIKKCKTNPGELASSPNCINAKKADNEISLDKRDGYRSRDPMNFSDKGK